MRTRLALGMAALAAVALTAPSALAAPAAKTLDGAKVKKLTLTATTTAQSNDTALVTDQVDGTDRMACEAPRCALLPFVYKPAKGVKGDVMFTLSWSIPASDFDLYVVSIGKGGERSRLGSCGGSAGMSEKVFVPASDLKTGRTYALLADFYRTPGEKVTGTVEMPAANSIKTTVPAAVDELALVNCTQ